ncbi:OmpA family protein [Luteolibacter pohnpeiensis]|nr:OmpA family protein [Luteolibacter pohnpeiensis]
MHRSNRTAWFFLCLSAVIAASALYLLLHRAEKSAQTVKAKPDISPTAKLAIQPPPDSIPSLDQPVPEEDPAVILKDLGIGVATVDPGELVNRIGNALEKGNLQDVAQLIGKDALDQPTLERLKGLSSGGSLKLRQPEGVREVGEIELNALARWSLQLEGKQAGRDRILLDLRNRNGRWSVERLALPPEGDQPVPDAQVADPLGITDAFLQSVLQQDFEFARNFVNPDSVSDTKIAALCILFEEGTYHLRANKPLRAMYRRDDAAGYLANVVTPEAKQTAQFTIGLEKYADPLAWRVSEINLDQLIADYTRRVAGGDIYYSPLVKNPQGGDTLALYFEFDQDEINPRTRRQLEIVALILKSDPGKKITLSGHTDAMGTDNYNNQLSERRADVVRDFLVKAGVATEQIITLAKGSSQPRRPNVTETGTDNPEGRRANRRTEIYLDF